MNLFKGNSTASFLHRLFTENSYLGCFTNNVDGLTYVRYGPDTVTNTVTDVTIDKCFTLCQGSFAFNVQYAGLEAGNLCYCFREGDNYARLGKIDDSDCNLPCVGDSSQTCGGEDAIAVYDCK